MIAMRFCRTCLGKEPSRDLFQLQDDNQLNGNGEKRSCEEIMLFCVSIQISQDEKRSTKLCELCYNKIIDFYNFKVLALKNDAHLNSIDSNATINIAVIDDYYIKKEESDAHFSEDENHNNQEDEPLIYYAKYIKEECKQENVLDEDLESIHKDTVQGTDIVPEFLVLANNPSKRKRGRPKKNNINKVKLKSEPKKKSEPKEKSKPKKKPQSKKICDQCGKQVRDLKQHIQHKHIPEKNQKTFECDLCGKTYIKKGTLVTHIKKRHFSTKQKCHLCGKLVVELKTHMLVIHNKAKLPFECVQCHHRFITSGKLAEHMYVHSEDRQFQCEHCSKTYRTKIVLNMHIRRMHNKEKSHMCQFCSKSFFKKDHLQSHIRTHEKCDKRFATTVTLRNHHLLHVDEKKHPCTICGATFIVPRAYKKHMLIHTKEKKYPCRFCEKRFHRSDHRNGHETNVHKQTRIVTKK